jgi:Tfp pilus assembly protein PilO
MWFNSRKQVISILIRHAVTAGLAIVIAVSISLFTGRMILKISSSLQQKERVSKMLAMRVENIQQLKNSLALLGENDKKILAVYPSTDNILDFVSLLESIAKQNSLKQSLKFGDFMPAYSAGDIQISKTDYSINLNGTVNIFKTYLKQLEEVSFVTKIGTISILAPSSGGWNGDSSITINGSLYAQQNQ